MKTLTEEQVTILKFYKLLGAKWIVVNKYGKGVFFETKPQEIKGEGSKDSWWHGTGKYWIDDLLNEGNPLVEFTNKYEPIEIKKLIEDYELRYESRRNIKKGV